jgi:hypothetical protein
VKIHIVVFRCWNLVVDTNVSEQHSDSMFRKIGPIFQAKRTTIYLIISCFKTNSKSEQVRGRRVQNLSCAEVFNFYFKEVLRFEFEVIEHRICLENNFYACAFFPYKTKHPQRTWPSTEQSVMNFTAKCTNVVIYIHMYVLNGVGIATGHGLDDVGVGDGVLVGLRVFSSPRRPDRLWGPPSLLSNVYREPFPRGLSGGGAKLTTHLQLVPRSRKCGSIHPVPHTPAWHNCLITEAQGHLYLNFIYMLNY